MQEDVLTGEALHRTCFLTRLEAAPAQADPPPARAAAAPPLLLRIHSRTLSAIARHPTDVSVSVASSHCTAHDVLTRLAPQLLSAVQALHGCDYRHSDIKPEVRISDFLVWRRGSAAIAGPPWHVYYYVCRRADRIDRVHRARSAQNVLFTSHGDAKCVGLHAPPAGDMRARG